MSIQYINQVKGCSKAIMFKKTVLIFYIKYLQSLFFIEVFGEKM